MRPRILVIAMEDSARVDALEAALESRSLEWARVAAFDGRAISADELAEVADLKAGRLLYGQSLSRTQVGCLLSHRAAYRQFLNGAAEWAIVLEDDAFPGNELQQFLDWLTSWHPDAPTIVECFSEGRINDARESRSIGPGLRLTRLRTYPGFTVAYAINRTAARLALAHEGRVGSRADWPAWAVHVDFWRTRPNLASHGLPGQPLTSTMVPSADSESAAHKAGRWAQLISGVTYTRLREHYPDGLNQYYRHAVLPSALYWRQRVSGKLRRG